MTDFPLNLGPHAKEEKRELYETVYALAEQGFRYKDIAEHLGISRGTVSGIVYRLRFYNPFRDEVPVPGQRYRGAGEKRQIIQREPYLSEYCRKKPGMYWNDRNG